MNADQKKIGIITILKINNYGAELQAYALQKKLQDLGFNAEIIDYLFYKHPKHTPTRASRSFVHLGVKKRLKEFIYPILIKFKQKNDIATERLEKFENFHFQYSRMSPTYCSMDELESARLDYDVYIVGSDQVWNPYSNTSILPYLLHFAPDDKLIMSYASSFGVSEIPEEAKPYYQKYLNRFNRLSVREETGIRLIKELTGRAAELVLDPTLLLTRGEWSKIAVYPEIKTPYILIYELAPISYIKKLAEYISLQTGYLIVRICKDTKKVDKETDIFNICDAGPQEFIGLLLNASFVITNSFHGTAFSINFQKPFFSVLSSRKNNNSRIEDLLNMLGLEHRLIKDNAPFPSKDNVYYDFTEAESLLEKERQKSIDYLLSINQA